jgi:hypothetical protein
MENGSSAFLTTDRRQMVRPEPLEDDAHSEQKKKEKKKGVVQVFAWRAGWRLEIAPTTTKPTYVGWVLNLRRQVLLVLPRLAVAGRAKLCTAPSDE